MNKGFQAGNWGASLWGEGSIERENIFNFPLSFMLTQISSLTPQLVVHLLIISVDIY